MFYLNFSERECLRGKLNGNESGIKRLICDEWFDGFEEILTYKGNVMKIKNLILNVLHMF